MEWDMSHTVWRLSYNICLVGQCGMIFNLTWQVDMFIENPWHACHPGYGWYSYNCHAHCIRYYIVSLIFIILIGIYHRYKNFFIFNKNTVFNMLIFPTLLFVKCWQFQLNMYSSFFGVRLKQWLSTICLLIMFILMANKVHKQFWSVVFWRAFKLQNNH